MSTPLQLPDGFLEKLLESASGTFWELLGCELHEAGVGYVKVTMEAEKRHLNTIGILHGGVHASLLDNAMGLAAMFARPGIKIVTTNLNMHYLVPLELGLVTVTGTIIHQSRSIITTQGEIRDAEGRLGSWGTGSYKVQ
ncbi:PaaI family thioesterase [Paenibacillus koleovorans]|uniref:PaaI family thioesterase n=1 Tax=Paenibacillus koleovorans TaxID=121608 RepID=UPI000FDB4AA7|nr:PaaI family thioesterase [Paenibacillus koleovorans]